MHTFFSCFFSTCVAVLDDGHPHYVHPEKSRGREKPVPHPLPRLSPQKHSGYLVISETDCTALQVADATRIATAVWDTTYESLVSGRAGILM